MSSKKNLLNKLTILILLSFSCRHMIWYLPQKRKYSRRYDSLLSGTWSWKISLLRFLSICEVINSLVFYSLSQTRQVLTGSLWNLLILTTFWVFAKSSTIYLRHNVKCGSKMKTWAIMKEGNFFVACCELETTLCIWVLGKQHTGQIRVTINTYLYKMSPCQIYPGKYIFCL